MPIACATRGERYEYETNLLIKANMDGIRFKEVQIETIYENDNLSSHFNPIRDSINIYSVLIRYSLSSFVSVIIDYFVFFCLSLAQIPVVESTYISRLCAAGVNFSVNRKVVFKSRSAIVLQLLKYITLLLISGTISGFGILFFTNAYHFNRVLIKIPIEIILYIINYYVQAHYIFASKPYKE